MQIWTIPYEFLPYHLRCQPPHQLFGIFHQLLPRRCSDISTHHQLTMFGCKTWTASNLAASMPGWLCAGNPKRSKLASIPHAAETSLNLWVKCYKWTMRMLSNVDILMHFKIFYPFPTWRAWVKSVRHFLVLAWHEARSEKDAARDSCSISACKIPSCPLGEPGQHAYVMRLFENKGNKHDDLMTLFDWSSNGKHDVNHTSSQSIPYYICIRENVLNFNSHIYIYI